MKIELNIEAEHLGETIVDVFKNLTKEQKEQMAKDVMQKWFDEPYKIEEKVKDKILIDRIKQKYAGKELYIKNEDGYRGNDRKVESCTDEEILRCREIQSERENFRSSKDIMIIEITNEIIKYYREQAAEMVKTDPQIKEIMQQTLEGIKADFPKFIHDAMFYWFTQNLNNTMNEASNAMIQSVNSQNIANELAQRITGNNFLSR